MKDNLKPDNRFFHFDVNLQDVMDILLISNLWSDSSKLSEYQHFLTDHFYPGYLTVNMLNIMVPFDLIYFMTHNLESLKNTEPIISYSRGKIQIT
jgi:hypothetical protein